ncbi:MAG: hypothetical protein ACO1NU_13380 [Arcticibacter sp.]
MKSFIKGVFCLSVIWFSYSAIGQAQIIVNPDGTHSVVTGNIVVNPNGTHSIIAGNIVVNPDGTHSVVAGNVVVNPNGTHSVLTGKTSADPGGANKMLPDDSDDENTSRIRTGSSVDGVRTWLEYRQSRSARKEERQKARAIRRLTAKENSGDTESPK